MNPNWIHHTKFLLPDANIKYAVSVYLDIRVDVALALRSRSKSHFSKTKKSSVPEIFHLRNVLTRKKQSKITQNGKVSATKLENAWQDAVFFPTLLQLRSHGTGRIFDRLK